MIPLAPMLSPSWVLRLVSAFVLPDEISNLMDCYIRAMSHDYEKQATRLMLVSKTGVNDGAPVGAPGAGVGKDFPDETVAAGVGGIGGL